VCRHVLSLVCLVSAAVSVCGALLRRRPLKGVLAVVAAHSGGRPAAVNAENVRSFVRLADGSLRFKYIVEGANLFFTQVCGVYRSLVTGTGFSLCCAAP
jgi:hypothetical protein